MAVGEPARTGYPLGEFLQVGIGCALQTCVLAALPWIALWWAVKRGAPMRGAAAGALTGAAALLFAFALMRIGCPIDEPLHLVTWHLLPALVLTALSALAGAAWLAFSPARSTRMTLRRNFPRFRENDTVRQALPADTKDPKDRGSRAIDYDESSSFPKFRPCLRLAAVAALATVAAVSAKAAENASQSAGSATDGGLRRRMLLGRGRRLQARQGRDPGSLRLCGRRSVDRAVRGR